MIYEKETWDRKTQAMGQFTKVMPPFGYKNDYVQGLEELVIISEDSSIPGRYVAYYRFIFRSFIPL